MEQHIELLQKLGKLAKLEVSETDEKLKEDFKKIVEYMDVIHEVDATGIQPLSYIQFEEGIQKEQMLAECMQFEERENTEYVFEKNLRFQKNIRLLWLPTICSRLSVYLIIRHSSCLVSWLSLERPIIFSHSHRISVPKIILLVDLANGG